MIGSSSFGLNHMKINIKGTYQPDINKYNKQNGKEYTMIGHYNSVTESNKMVSNSKNKVTYSELAVMYGALFTRADFIVLSLGAFLLVFPLEPSVSDLFVLCPVRRPNTGESSILSSSSEKDSFTSFFG